MRLKKTILSFLSLIIVACFLGCFVACSKSASFLQNEYEVKSGDKIAIEGKANFVILGDKPNGVSISKDGVFTITENAVNGSQILVALVIKGKVVDTATCNIIANEVTPVVTIGNLSSYVIDGEFITATSTPSYSVSYALKEESVGITIDEVTGKVSFTDKVTEDQPFTVIATAKGVREERTFFATVENFVTLNQSVVIAELNGKDDLTVDIIYPNAELKEQGVLGLKYGKTLVEESDYSYDQTQDKLTLKRSLLNKLKEGENKLNILTAKNTVNLTIKNARLIATAKQLASIGATKESLSGYYVQVCNIDLKTYLSQSNEGWYPIGVYKDVTDGTATKMAFNGTYDGNGYSITNFYINRTGEVAFNSGLFGYLTNNATVINVNLLCDTEKTYSVRSYSGGLAGVNCGIIRDCAVYANIIADGCKTVGIFVGRNEGAIYSSYAYGKAIGKEKIGAFCGENMGKILNCHVATNEPLAFCGIGSKGETVYSNKEEMFANADFSSWVNWDFLNEVPFVKGIDFDYGLRAIEVLNSRTEYVKNMTFDIAVVTDPADFDGLTLTYEVIKGTGISVVNGKVNLNGAVNGEYTVRISCGEVFTDYNFTVGDTAKDIVQIYTVADFIAFKNDITNYSKTVILMSDLDFNNQELTSVGYYFEEGENIDASGVFTGVFDGNGYTIKNLNVVRNSYTQQTQNGNYDTNKFHPAYYNVGLFSYVTGTIKNLTLQNVKSVPNYQGELTGNYVGVMCGALFGLIENCNINGCYYYGKDDDSLISGIVCGANHGSIVGVKIDGADYGE